MRKITAKATAKATCNEKKRIRSLLMLNAPTDKRHAMTGFAAPQVILQLKCGTACKQLPAGNIDSLPTKKSIEGPSGGQRMLNSATPSVSQYSRWHHQFITYLMCNPLPVLRLNNLSAPKAITRYVVPSRNSIPRSRPQYPKVYPVPDAARSIW